MVLQEQRNLQEKIKSSMERGKEKKVACWNLEAIPKYLEAESLIIHVSLKKFENSARW